MHKKTKTGIIGEYYVMYRLAKLAMRSQKMPTFFDYDILVQNGCRVEVKTATPTVSRRTHKDKVYTTTAWRFLNYTREVKENTATTQVFSQEERDRDCDFFVFVGLDKKQEPQTCFIVPKHVVGVKKLISIPTNYMFGYRNTVWKAYADEWGLITDFK